MDGKQIMKNPIKMDDLGVRLFLETPIWFHATGTNICTIPWTVGLVFIRMQST